MSAATAARLRALAGVLRNLAVAIFSLGVVAPLLEFGVRTSVTIGP